MWIHADSIGTQYTASIDPTFSTTATGGSFAISRGATSAVPEPAGASAVLASMLGLVAVAAQRRRRLPGATTRHVA